MKPFIIAVIFTFVTSIIIAQPQTGDDYNLGKIIPCNYTPEKHQNAALKFTVENFLKGAGVNCDTSNFKIKISTKYYVNATKSNVGIIAEKPDYKKLIIHYKITASYVNGQLDFQVYFQSRKPGSNQWSKYLSGAEENYASEIFDNWFEKIKSNICK